MNAFIRDEFRRLISAKVYFSIMGEGDMKTSLIYKKMQDCFHGIGKGKSLHIKINDILSIA